MTNAKRTKPPPRTDATTPTEKDEGYNESHGYGPGHGGPSGPGDAPSNEPATVVPLPEPDSKDE